MADKLRLSSKYNLEDDYEHSDSDNEYSTDAEKIVSKLRKSKHDNSESEEEIYAFSESEDEEEELADSDIEGQEKSDDDLPDPKAWGKNRSSYYSTDYVDKDYGGFGGDKDEDAALMEGEEAKNIQKRLVEQLEDTDFNLDFLDNQSSNTDGKEVIGNDLSDMSNRQKLQLFNKESPEFAGLISDFKSNLNMAKQDLYPMLKLVEEGKLPECPASKFIKTYYDLILNYCTNISFYLLLKTQRISIQNHPVVRRLYQYRQMLNKIEPIYSETIKPQISIIIQTVKNSLDLHLIKLNTTENNKRKARQLIESRPKKLKILNDLEKDENDMGLSGNGYVINDSLSNKSAIRDSESEVSGSDNDSVNDRGTKQISVCTSQDVNIENLQDKREITYQMAKNKGLTPHRKKEQRNPRVKHKLKYRKAKIRRKGAIREPRTEIHKYGGESSGIKANVKKSVQIK